MQIRPVMLTFTVILGISGVVSAQSHIQLFSSFAKPGRPIPQSCQDESKVLQKALTVYPQPSNWTYVIACDDHAWQFALTHMGLDEHDGKHYGETDFDPQIRVTYFRGSTFIAPDSPEATGDHVIAHELAHIALKTHDERKAEAQALAWMKAVTDKVTAATVASR
jgi:hypothetical protein